MKEYQEFLQNTSLKGKFFEENGEIILELAGKSAHGMEPNNGVNAGLQLAKFLYDYSEQLDAGGKQFIHFAFQFLYEQSRGEGFGIQYSDEITGDLTMNVGRLDYDLGKRRALWDQYALSSDIQYGERCKVY